MKNKTDYTLANDEQTLLSAFEAGELTSDFTEERRQQLMAIAESSVKKDKRINIRLAQRDLEAIQRRAMQEGLPYQTLIASILHKYASGSLKDLSA
ncbi:MAG: hypothetical protein IE913_10060 [Halothiobacillus sp.]|nr:hypothetical protein [Halothiobacillus sp.]